MIGLNNYGICLLYFAKYKIIQPFSLSASLPTLCYFPITFIISHPNSSRDFDEGIRIAQLFGSSR